MLPEIRTLLYATDLGERAPRVFRHALSLARRYGARIILLHVIEPLSPTASALVHNVVPEATLKAIEKSGYADVRAEIDRRLKTFCEEELGGEAELKTIIADIRIVVGNPARAILDEAAAAKTDLIVMGTHSHVGIERMILGSVANKVVQRATLPVLLVPIQTAA